MSTEQSNKAREAMELLGDRVFGLLVSHCGITMQLAWDGGTRWSAIATADDGGDPVEVEGFGSTPDEAMDEAAGEVEAIENPDPDGEDDE